MKKIFNQMQIQSHVLLQFQILHQHKRVVIMEKANDRIL